jgi:ubiquinone biosynthesis protein UbiJ
MSPSLFSSFKPVAGRALQAALNRALALDPDTRSALAALDGRSVSLVLDTPSLGLRIGVDGEQLTVGPVDAGHAADLAVHGSRLGALLGQLPMFAGRRRPGADPGRINVSGDAELARRLQQLAAGFDPDWQQPLVAAFGPVAGVQLARLLQNALMHMRNGARDLAGNAAEFLTEESRDVIPRAEQNAFHDDVDGLRDDVERLAARVARLTAAGGAR